MLDATTQRATFHALSETDESLNVASLRARLDCCSSDVKLMPSSQSFISDTGGSSAMSVATARFFSSVSSESKGTVGSPTRQATWLATGTCSSSPSGRATSDEFLAAAYASWMSRSTAAAFETISSSSDGPRWSDWYWNRQSGFSHTNGLSDTISCFL